MKKSRRTELQIETDKRAKERMKRFEENQAAIKEGKKKPKKEKVEENDGVRCHTCWQKKEGEDWKEIQYFYNIKDKVSKNVFKKYSPIEEDEK